MWRSIVRTAISVAVLLALGVVNGGAGPAGAAPAPVDRADGVIAAIEGTTVVITTRTGTTVRVLTTADTRFLLRQPARLEQIRPNDFVGVTARREPDGSLVALAITIFPPEFKGRVREGQFPMETGNLMTNAYVFQNVRRVEGRVLYLKFPEGTAVIAVPRDAEIFRLTVIRLADLRSGMRVMARGGLQADGSLTAASVTVEGPAR
ncbi:MAG: DUF5666 domain-containing protein [Armatimonadota bacterium]|nr:DUF5666 domain-containing protein [Armatimonadota bacterium]